MSDNIRKYLVFSLTGRQYAIDLADVAEVVEQPALWPIPLVPPCYHGAMNFHGSIVAVMDLAAFFGLPGGQAAGQAIVLDPRIASLAFATGNIIRIILLELDGISAYRGDEPFACGELVLPEGRAVLLDPSAIAAHAAGTIGS